MIISLDPSVDGDMLAETIASAVAEDGRIAEITHATAWSLNDKSPEPTVQKAAVDEGGPARVNERRRLDALQTEATRLIADELRAAGLYEQAARGPTPGRFEQAPVGPGFYSALEREVGAIDAKALTAFGWAERMKGLIIGERDSVITGAIVGVIVFVLLAGIDKALDSAGVAPKSPIGGAIVGAAIGGVMGVGAIIGAIIAAFIGAIRR